MGISDVKEARWIGAVTVGALDECHPQVPERSEGTVGIPEVKQALWIGAFRGSR